ncbi:hypothetical protein B0H12DRAFT_1117829 [Mycena haematopus]|nr:hypothetical protein B0H12DRAFT_1117829 [Mycena haematopus]
MCDAGALKLGYNSGILPHGTCFFPRFFDKQLSLTAISIMDHCAPYLTLDLQISAY